MAIGLATRRAFRFMTRSSCNHQDQFIPENKRYRVRPRLINRIFRPKTSDNELLPLFIDVHGGGWAVADPDTDDEFCSFLAQKYKIIVVSVDYFKAPAYPFPLAVHDIAAIANAVLQDDSLPIDTTRVTIGGFSAGGNLAFAASQMGSLKGRISSIVAFFPCLDLAENLDMKLERRPREAGADGLESSANFLAWAYVPSGIDLKDPLLSPIYAKREDLPKNAYLICGEYDLLCHEGKKMAESLVDSREERKEIPDVLAEDGWQQGGVRWECARGRYHAFTHPPFPLPGRKERERRKYVEEVYGRVGTWLRDEM